MSPLAFARLCELLRDSSWLKDSRNAIVEEQVAEFLYVLWNNVRNRTMSFFFRRFGETISRNFDKVLRAIISLEDQFFRQPNGVDIPQHIASNNRFYPYFKVKNFSYIILSKKVICFFSDAYVYMCVCV